MSLSKAAHRIVDQRSSRFISTDVLFLHTPSGMKRRKKNGNPRKFRLRGQLGCCLAEDAGLAGRQRDCCLAVRQSQPAEEHP